MGVNMNDFNKYLWATNNCNKCLWATRDGGCASWDCEFVEKSEAYKAWLKGAHDGSYVEWIPVTERLPFAEYGESKSVLCCMESGLQEVLYHNGGNWCHPTGEVYIWINHKNGWHDAVVAWMPLPEPYVPEE